MPVNPPRPKGPPLNALRAFEAAARLGGFSAAAEELHVTPGAVAQQVKSLEEWAGAELFERRAQGVVLSPVGARVMPEMEAAFDRLGEAVQSLRAATGAGQVHIAALPAIAQLWLSPRLPAIRSALPDLSLSVSALEVRPNLKRDPFDIALFFGNEEEGQLVEQDEIFPVCAPALAEQLGSPQDLVTLPCLGDTTWAQDWEIWLAAQGTDIRVSGPVFSLYALAVEEAINGAGVLIGHAPLVRRHLQSGSLVQPFATSVRQPQALVASLPGSRRRNPAAAQVLELLLQTS